MEEVNTEQQKFILETGTEKFELDHRFSEISGLAQFAQQAWGFDENGECKLEINQELSDSNIISDIVEWVKAQNFNPPKIEQIKSEKIELNLQNDQANTKFISKFSIKDPQQLKKYFDVASYLQLNSFKKLIVARVATELHFGQNEADFKKMEKRVGATEQLTVEGEEELINNHKWIQQY